LFDYFPITQVDFIEQLKLLKTGCLRICAKVASFSRNAPSWLSAALPALGGLLPQFHSKPGLVGSTRTISAFRVETTDK
jgi:hypothetical protein